MTFGLIAIALLRRLVPAVTAALGAGGWSPPPPTPDDYDWVRLISDEWLKGEVKVMYKDSLEFDSKELDLLTIDWLDIKELRTAHVLEVRCDRLGDLVDVVAELWPELCDNPGKERGHLVEIGIIRRIAVDPVEPDALKKLVHPGSHGPVIDQADVRKHMREAGFARIPVGRHRAGIERFVKERGQRLAELRSGMDAIGG